MKFEHLILALALYLMVHYLLATKNLSPAWRRVLGIVESKALTQTIADVVAI